MRLGCDLPQGACSGVQRSCISYKCRFYKPGFGRDQSLTRLAATDVRRFERGRSRFDPILRLR